MRPVSAASWMTVSLVAVLASPALARDLSVPREHRTIGDALAVAHSGDRVVVTGGRHRDVTVATDGVTLVGRGAILLGDVNIEGDGVTVSGFRFGEHARMTLSGADATFSGNRATARASAALYVDGGDRALVAAN